MVHTPLACSHQWSKLNRGDAPLPRFDRVLQGFEDDWSDFGILDDQQQSFESRGTGPHFNP